MRAATVLVAFAIALAAAGTACSSGGGSTKAFCSTVRTGDNPLDLFDRYDPTDVATARDQLQRGVDRLQQMERAAPSEIHDDMQVLVDVGTKLIAALDPAAGGKPPPDFSSDFRRVQDASAAVTRFASQQCGVSLDSASPGLGSQGG
ncbi:MAG TPA: hypothetical protein VGJ03_16480 [Acidimicrobiales bacterium]